MSSTVNNEMPVPGADKFESFLKRFAIDVDSDFTKQVSELQPDDQKDLVIQVLLDLAEAHLAHRACDKAHRLFSKVSKVKGSGILPHLGIARCLIMSGELERAKSLLMSIVKREPDNAEVELTVAQLFIATGDSENAFTALISGHSKLAFVKASSELLQYADADWKLEKLIHSVEDVISQHPDRGDLFELMAYAQKQLGDLKGALVSATQAQKLGRDTHALAKEVAELDEKNTNKRRKALSLLMPKDLLEEAVDGHYLAENPYPVHEMIRHYKTRKVLKKGDAIVSLGGCFSLFVSKWLNNNGFTHVDNPWGIVYSTQCIRQIVMQTFEPEKWKPVNPFWMLNGKYYDPYRKDPNVMRPFFMGKTEKEAHGELERVYDESRRIFTKLNTIMFVVGLTEVFRHKVDKYAYYTNPPEGVYDQTQHEYYNLRYEDVISDLEYSITVLREHNPDLNVVLATTPVPLPKTWRTDLGPYLANEQSKSVIIAAQHEVVNRMENVQYFPAYEIVRNDPARHVHPDGRHVATDSYDYIMRAFRKMFEDRQ